MRGLRQSLAAAATKCGGDLEPHRDCLYVATSRYLVSRYLGWSGNAGSMRCQRRMRIEVTLPAVTPGDQASREASQASSLTILLVTCHVSRVT